MKLGLQVYSVRDDAARDFCGTMKKVRDMGYDGVELAGLYGLNGTQIREILDENGLECISAHVPYSEFINDLDKTISEYKTIGCKYVAFPYMDEQNRPGSPSFPQVVENTVRIGKACKENGLQLLYHNHDFEFVKMPDGTFGLDYLYASVPSELLATELDTCWVLVAGQSPDGYVRKYAGRCPLVHLKDFIGSKSENMYDLIGKEKKAKTDGAFAFRPVGSGVQNIPAIVEAAKESGTKWLIVEQDSSSDRPALEAAKISCEYVRGLI